MSITLTSGKLVAINGVTQENDSVGAVTLMEVDYVTGNVRFCLKTGSINGLTLAPGVYGEDVTLIINAITGNWRDSNGHSGNIAGATLTNFVSQMKAIRNTVETFAAGASGVMPGTQVAW
jgi:hypothetical protein